MLVAVAITPTFWQGEAHSSATPGFSTPKTGMVLAVSGYVTGPRVVGGTRSDLLFTILGRLREQGIALSAPQSMVLLSDGTQAVGPAPAPTATPAPTQG